MNFAKHRFRTISILIGVVGCLGGLGWLVYLNGNFNGLQSHRSGPIATGSSNRRAYSAVEDAFPLAFGGRPTDPGGSRYAPPPARPDRTNLDRPAACPTGGLALD